ncbi:MAG: peptidylprolyl isomerase [Actinomycetota bacterium]
MKRILLLLAVLALTAAACGGSSSTAANVDAEEITVGDVEGMFYEIDGEFTDEQFAGYLSTMIQWTAIEHRAAEELSFEASEEAIAEEIDGILAETGYAGDLDTFLSEQNISETGLERYATQFLIEDAVAADLGESVEKPTLDDAQAEIDASPMDYAEVCASHILVETEEEADAVGERLGAGEDFALIAQEVSIDTGSGAAGGSLGCASPAGYVPEFAEATMAAPIGEVTEPVESEFGFHFIVVEDRTIATAAEVLFLMEERAVFDAVNDWLFEAVTTADVTVEEDYGTWSLEPSPHVEPPAAAEDAG